MESAGLIMLIEDDQDIRETMVEVLEMENYSVVSATHGREALAILDGPSPLPSVILLDLMMPVMNGWEFLNERSTRPKLKDIPVIIVSAAGDKAKTAVCDAFIKKPVELDVLFDTIKKFVNQKPPTS